MSMPRGSKIFLGVCFAALAVAVGILVYSVLVSNS
jgi:hypothetical protein